MKLCLNQIWKVFILKIRTFWKIFQMLLHRFLRGTIYILRYLKRKICPYQWVQCLELPPDLPRSIAISKTINSNLRLILRGIHKMTLPKRERECSERECSIKKSQLWVICNANLRWQGEGVVHKNRKLELR